MELFLLLLLLLEDKSRLAWKLKISKFWLKVEIKILESVLEGKIYAYNLA